jgi:hypothetical protein
MLSLKKNIYSSVKENILPVKINKQVDFIPILFPVLRERSGVKFRYFALLKKRMREFQS